MKVECLIGTRKGLFHLKRSPSSESWDLAPVGFIGDPVTMALADSRSGRWYAALNLGHFGVKLHRAAPGGAEWEEISAPEYPEKPEGEEDLTPWSLMQIWALEEGGPQRGGHLWCGTIPGGLFSSDDGGKSWELNQPLWNRPERREWFGGGYDHPGIHSICVDPRDSDRVSVAVSCGGVWQSGDGGATWELLGEGMRADFMPPERSRDLQIQDPHRLTQCPSEPDAFWIQHHNGIYRSRDNCRSWQEIADAGPSVFGFAVCVHPQEPDTVWFVPAVKDECRVPVDGRFVVTRTRDGGSSFEVLSNGLPEGGAYDLVYRHGMDVDQSGDLLIVGSTSGSLWISEDQGDSFSPITHHLPPIYCVRFFEPA